MLLGIQITSNMVVAGGVVLISLLGFQLLLGFRKITFKGKRHLTVHKWTAVAMLVLAAIHGITALAMVGII